MIPRRCNQIGMASGKSGGGAGGGRRKKNIFKSWVNCYILAEPRWARWRQQGALRPQQVGIPGHPAPPPGRQHLPACSVLLLQGAEKCWLPQQAGHTGVTVDTLPSRVSRVRSSPFRGKGCQQLWPVWWRGKRSQVSHSQSLTESILTCCQATSLKRKAPLILCFGSFSEMNFKTCIKISVHCNKIAPLNRLRSAGQLNSIRAFLLSWHQTCSMEMVSLQHVFLQIHSGTHLTPVAALPVLQRSLNASSISTTQLSPSLSCTDQSAEKQAQKDSNLKKHGKGNGQKWLREVSTQRECQIKVKFMTPL